MPIPRSRVLALAFAVALAGAVLGPNPSAGALEVVDILGRTVTLDGPAERIILGEGRFIAAIGILERERPLDRIAGMLNDFRRLDPAGFAHYAEAFPEIEEIPIFGETSEDTVSLERALTLQPDVAVFGVSGHGPTARSEGLIETLERAGVKTVFVDFRDAPLVNTPRSVEILGRVLGREAEAREFVAFYDEALAAVTDRVAALGDAPRPSLMIEAHVGLREQCCFAIAKGMFADMAAAAGGDNIAADRIPGPAGMLDLEYVVDTAPDVYIGTAIGSPGGTSELPGAIVLGAGVDRETARASLVTGLGRTGIETLPAVRESRAYGIWHHFYSSPLNVYAVQRLAKWLHPEAFADLDPEATLAELYRRFQPVALDGVYAIGLADG